MKGKKPILKLLVFCCFLFISILLVSINIKDDVVAENLLKLQKNGFYFECIIYFLLMVFEAIYFVMFSDLDTLRRCLSVIDGGRFQRISSVYIATSFLVFIAVFAVIFSSFIGMIVLCIVGNHIALLVSFVVRHVVYLIDNKGGEPPTPETRTMKN